jgi:hypothetical protein
LPELYRHPDNAALDSEGDADTKKEGQMKRLLDPTFKYVPSGQTDIRKTFARVRREQAQQSQPKAVVPLRKRS